MAAFHQQLLAAPRQVLVAVDKRDEMRCHRWAMMRCTRPVRAVIMPIRNNRTFTQPNPSHHCLLPLYVANQRRQSKLPQRAQAAAPETKRCDAAKSISQTPMDIAQIMDEIFRKTQFTRIMVQIKITCPSTPRLKNSRARGMSESLNPSVPSAPANPNP